MVSRILNKPDFNTKNFVEKVSQGGLESLQNTEEQLAKCGAETRDSLKASVYKNYAQFIDSAKDISVIEGEMYQISHMLAEQRSVMSSMMSTSFAADHAGMVLKEDEGRQEGSQGLVVLMEQVQGCALMSEMRDRYVVHDGDVVEVDPEGVASTKNVHLFLLNDSLMVAPWLQNRKGPVRYEYEILYNLDSLAVEFVSDPNFPCTFRLLTFPGNRCFQCENGKARRDWKDLLDKTKRKYLSTLLQDNRLSTRLRESTLMGVTDLSASLMTVGSDDFNDSRASVLLDESNIWLQQISEQLDLCIVQRDFNGAVVLIEKARIALADLPAGSQTVQELRNKVEQYVRQLTVTLSSELELNVHMNRHLEAKSINRCVTWLIRLGKALHACDLLLHLHSKVIEGRLNQLKLEDSSTLYVRTLSSVFFASLDDATAQFLLAFQDQKPCYAAFVTWAYKEIEKFVKIVSTQVSSGKTSLSTLVQCISIAKTAAAELKDVGLDLSFAITSLLYLEIQRAIGQHRDQLFSVVDTKHRTTDTEWNLMRFSKRADIDQLNEEMKALDVDISPYIDTDKLVIMLSMHVVQFTKAYCQFCKDCLALHTVELHLLTTESLVQIFRAELRAMETFLKTPRFAPYNKFIMKCCQFLLKTVLPSVCARYKSVVGIAHSELEELAAYSGKLEKLSKSTLGELV